MKSQLKPSWISPEINEARHKRDFYHKLKDTENYKQWRNKVTSLIKEAKADYYKQAIEKNKNTTDIWKYLKELNPKSGHSIPDTLEYETKCAENTSEIVEMFNNWSDDFYITIKLSKYYSMITIFSLYNKFIYTMYKAIIKHPIYTISTKRLHVTN